MAGDAHLLNLAVREDVARAGVGRRADERLLRRRCGPGAEGCTLEVRDGNAPARALYESLGMHAAGVRPGYYADTDEHAVVMWGDVSPAAARVLAIETSCDETAAAVVEGGRDVLSSVVASQVDFHARFGGVVPEIASRKHTEAIVGVVDEALERAGISVADCDAIAVTYGPGLVGALVVGVAYAKGLSVASGVPLVGVNHLEGHIFANVLADERVRPPLVALIVSGGHTSLVHMPAWGVYRTLGETLDDAAGEAFDKVAKVLDLGYPGGPVLSRLAEEGDSHAIDFPRAMLHSGDLRLLAFRPEDRRHQPHPSRARCRAGHTTYPTSRPRSSRRSWTCRSPRRSAPSSRRAHTRSFLAEELRPTHTYASRLHWRWKGKAW